MIDKQKLRWLLGGGQLVTVNEDDLLTEYKTLVDDKADPVLESHIITYDYTMELVNYNEELVNYNGLVYVDIITKVYEKMAKLREEGYINVSLVNLSLTSANICYYRIKSYEEFRYQRMRQLTGGVTTVTPIYRAQQYIKRCLGINASHGGVRSVYIKLFLEGKVDEEDLKELIQSKNIDINLEPFYSYETPKDMVVEKDKEEEDYVLIG